MEVIFQELGYCIGKNLKKKKKSRSVGAMDAG